MKRRIRWTLLVEEQRRVAKSIIVEEFMKNEFESYISVDFYRASESTKKLFTDLSDLDYIFMPLQLTYKTSLKRRTSCIVLDEVQLCPKARSAIKALVEDGCFDYIEIGSLISIRKKCERYSYPE